MIHTWYQYCLGNTSSPILLSDGAEPATDLYRNVPEVPSAVDVWSKRNLQAAARLPRRLPPSSAPE